MALLASSKYGPIATQSAELGNETTNWRACTPFDLWTRDMLPMGAVLFRRVLDDLLHGVMVAVPQDESLATWEPSVGRPPLFRPDLPRIGHGPEGFTVKGNSEALNGP